MNQQIEYKPKMDKVTTVFSERSNFISGWNLPLLDDTIRVYENSSIMPYQY